MRRKQKIAAKPRVEPVAVTSGAHRDFTVGRLKQFLAAMPDDLPVMIEASANLAEFPQHQWVFENHGQRQMVDDKIVDTRYIVLASAVYAHYAVEVVTTDGAACVIHANY